MESKLLNLRFKIYWFINIDLNIKDLNEIREELEKNPKVKKFLTNS